ncbi:MAG: hypothetical protein LV479_01595, partial [Methylacidiphilales bacterium]|nr:hypothetical protein [Candidatus Methylacidiphilales bacterium]
KGPGFFWPAVMSLARHVAMAMLLARLLAAGQNPFPAQPMATFAMSSRGISGGTICKWHLPFLGVLPAKNPSLQRGRKSSRIVLAEISCLCKIAAILLCD